MVDKVRLFKTPEFDLATYGRFYAVAKIISILPTHPVCITVDVYGYALIDVKYNRVELLKCVLCDSPKRSTVDSIIGHKQGADIETPGLWPVCITLEDNPEIFKAVRRQVFSAFV